MGFVFITKGALFDFFEISGLLKNFLRGLGTVRTSFGLEKLIEDI